MFDFHKDKKRYFEMQFRTTVEYILPFLEEEIDLHKKLDVLEIGCAEAGVLKAFTNLDHSCIGIELSAYRVNLASDFMAEELKQKKIKFLTKNIYDINLQEDIGHKFDLIILKDVIEHIPGQEIFMKKIGDFLKVNGKIFFGFPPWQMPFGGHQQICKSKALKHLPYFHLLPMPIFKLFLNMAGEPELTKKEMIEIKQTGISIERFNRIIKKEGYKIDKHQLFFINPIYKYKFNLKVRKQWRWVEKIPIFRNFVSTCAYYLVSKN